MEGPKAVGLIGPLPVCILSVFPDTRSGNGSAHGLEGAVAYPRQARFQVLPAMIAAAQNPPEKAIKYNLKAIALEPGNVDAWQNSRGRRSDVGGHGTENWMDKARECSLDSYWITLRVYLSQSDLFHVIPDVIVYAVSCSLFIVQDAKALAILYFIHHSMLDVRCSMFMSFALRYKFQISLARCCFLNDRGGDERVHAVYPCLSGLLSTPLSLQRKHAILFWFFLVESLAAQRYHYCPFPFGK
jgi:hypothetical protein